MDNVLDCFTEGAVIEVHTEGQAEEKKESPECEPVSGPEQMSGTEAVSESKQVTEPEPESESKPEPESESKSEPEPESKQVTEPEPESKSEPESESKSEPESESKSEPEQEPQPSNDMIQKTEPEENSYEEILNSVEKITVAIKELDRTFKQKIMRDEAEIKVVDNMHSELQAYRNDMYASLVKPILSSVALMRNDMNISLKAIAGKEDEASKAVADILDYFMQSVLDILDLNEVTLIEAQPGDKFNPRDQRVVSKIKTEDENLHGTIAEIVNDGYIFRGKVIIPQKIKVYTK